MLALERQVQPATDRNHGLGDRRLPQEVVGNRATVSDRRLWSLGSFSESHPIPHRSTNPPTLSQSPLSF